MMVMETSVKTKFKIRLTSSNARTDSERKSYENESKATVPVLSCCNKRKLEPEVGGDKNDKRQKMDPFVKRQCGCILDTLLAHPHGFAFKSPVDPVALQIPDYFSVISHPMDLGTIKSKLAGNTYFNAEEFAADVKLTFSNAMLYNPPDNFVHHMAKELECLFLKKWKLLEAKWNRKMAIAQGVLPTGNQKIALITRKTSSSKSGLLGLHRRSPPLSSGSIAPVSITTSGVNTEKNCSEKSCVGSCFIARGSKASMPSEEKKKLKQDLMEILVGRMSEKLRSGFKKLGLQFSKKEIIDLEFDKFNDDVLWQLKRVLKDAKDSADKISSADGMKLHQKSLGSESDLNEESPVTATMAISGEGWTPAVNDEQDLKKALRAAMLKKRFAETISKANGDKADSIEVQQETKRLLCEEEAKIKALMRDEQTKKEAQREKERKAARAALEMMKRTLEHEDNLRAFKELEKLCGCSISYESGSGVVMRDLKNMGRLVNPLQHIGLRLKRDMIAAEDERVLRSELEEGEILD